jgi:transcriptional regulator with XRE-family HTH domain
MNNPDATKRIGEELKALRLSQGLTLRGLEAVTGIRNGRISEIESGILSPSVRTMSVLAKALGAELKLVKLPE